MVKTRFEFVLALIKKSLKAYFVFALANVCYKLIRNVLLLQRAKRLWKHLPGYDADPFARTFRKYAKTYDTTLFFTKHGLDFPNKDLVKLELPEPALLCNSPRSVQWLLKDDFDNITKPGRDNELFTLMRQFLGEEGIFTLQHGSKVRQTDHKMWHDQRKISSKIFTKSNFMNLFYDTFVAKSKLCIEELSKVEGKEKDLQEMFFSFTMDSIEKFFMGNDVNTIQGGMSEYAKHFDEAHKSMMEVMTTEVPFSVLALKLLPFPFGTLTLRECSHASLLMRHRLSKSKPYQKMKHHVKALDEYILKYIKETRGRSDLSSRKDIIANFLNSKIGDEITDKTLRDIVLNLTIAGRDTTACALTWLFFELTQNLDVQEKLFEEIEEKLEGRIPTMSDLDPEQMPYLHGAMYEALRLYPPVPNDGKTNIEECTYLDGTVIPANTPLLYNPRAIGRNPETYPNPTQFDPTRWIPFKQPSLYEFPVFQAGPRFCLGKDMAQLEMKLLTVMLLQKFKFKLREGEEKLVKSSLMLTQSCALDEKRKELALHCIPEKR